MVLINYPYILQQTYSKVALRTSARKLRFHWHKDYKKALPRINSLIRDATKA